MNDPLPAALPAGARLGLEDGDGLTRDRLDGLPVAAAAALADQALVHGLLPLALQPAEARHAYTARVTGAIVPDAARFTRAVVGRLPPAAAGGGPGAAWRSRPRARPVAFAAAVAASLLIALLLRSGDAGIATLLRSESATWEQPPTSLVAGTRLVLRSGLAELDLDGRGRVVLEGPADLELASATRAVLRRGRLVLHVTPAGHGYRIETPSGTLIDLGTRFGVSVGADGSAEAHVIEGSIQAIAAAGARPVTLQQNDAAHLVAGRLERLAADPGAFYTSLPPAGAERPDQLRWRCDEGQGTVLQAQVQGFAGLASGLVLKAARDAALPQWIAGVHGQALSFDGRGGFAESDFPGIAGTRARTVACWIRVPQDFTPADGFAIVSWGQFSSAGRGAVWQLSLNPLAQDGALGRLRIGTHGGLLVGSTDLRDGRWHHVAAVMYGGARPDIGTHVLAYVDGRLEPISRRTLLAVDTRIAEGGHGVWVGRNVTHTDDARPHPQAFLRAAVDDLVITAGALSQSAIRELMDSP